MGRLLALALIASTSTSAIAADVNAIRQCLTVIQRRNACAEFINVESVSQKDRRVSNGQATLIANIQLRVMKPFDGRNSAVTDNCTGSTWNINSVNTDPSAFGPMLRVGQTMTVEKAFTFLQFGSGWRCTTETMKPVSNSIFTNNLAAPPRPVLPTLPR